MMDKFFLCFLIGILLLTMLMLFRLFFGTGIFDRFIGILVIATNVILILIAVGFVDARRAMYVDVAISYGILGFISSVILAKFIGQRGGKEDDPSGGCTLKSARQTDHRAALRSFGKRKCVRKKERNDPKGGGGSARYFSIVYLAAGEKDHRRT